MRSAIFALALVTIAAPALAESIQPAASQAAASTVRKGMMLRDVNDQRLARVDSIKPDGSVGIILASRFVVVPAESLTVADGKLITKLSKAELSR